MNKAQNVATTFLDLASSVVLLDMMVFYPVWVIRYDPPVRDLDGTIRPLVKILLAHVIIAPAAMTWLCFRYHMAVRSMFPNLLRHSKWSGVKFKIIGYVFGLCLAYLAKHLWR